ncbi:alpha amylase N-terminal ig-like domain-containing protein [Thermococcus aggregans]|uniref:Alpha amylase N-terminal ig-like domain-containing protein n=1 Tax=Thermococcus aggregans TaxID=110163 RepID=A0A9E7MYV5_THEAG|nr:alpha amylase N-terminal ig-like domain-containing protein [Thermococcus aggregans]USS41267.1 alpha amylase N-terminal ig-like domain-containing protein [Thermococcus aggregans]
MYKIFGFKEDDYFGKVGIIEFSIPKAGSYAYLLGNFNAFNEGSFRMKEKGDRWHITVALPEGIWYYAFSVDGKQILDPENKEKTYFRRLSYKAEREASVAKIFSGEEIYHYPCLTHLYSIGDYTYIRLRALRGVVKKAFLIEEKNWEMRKKASDELFDYFEVRLPKKESLNYYFRVQTVSGTIEYGDFDVNIEEHEKKYKIPSWILTRVFYQIMPDRFFNGNPENDQTDPIDLKNSHHYGGDLEGIIQKIDYLTELGINSIYLTPIFESMTYHGYDVVDYYHVARKFGGDKAFEELTRELHKRDIKLILDGVFHHTSFFHPYFQNVVKNGENSEYKDFYRITGFPVVTKEFLDILASELPWDEKYKRLKSIKRNYESFYSVWLMPRLNHDNKKVREFIRDVMEYWIKKGADGWRLDVAHGVPPEVWEDVREKLPGDVYLVGEVMDDARLWIFNKFHGTMNYPLYEAILRFFVEKEIDAREFLNWLELLSAYYGPVEYVMYNFLDNHDVDRMLSLLKNKRKYLCALVFLFTYRGIPAIYYGDEIGMENADAPFMERSRAPMEWDMEKWDMDIFYSVKKLIKLRKTSKALQIGAFVPLEFRGGLLLYRRELNGERILVGINYSRHEEHLPLLSSFEILFQSGSFDKATNKLGPYSSIVIKEL